jgi:8-oxo-dGTP diphosphatase
MKKGVIGILFSPDKKEVLVIKRSDIPIWVLPGGGIEDDETPEQAIEREFFEETGIPVQTKRLVGFYTPQNRLTRETYVFECEMRKDRPISSADHETLASYFAPLEKMPTPFFFLHEEWILEALNSQTPIFRPITSITYLVLIKNICLHPILILRYFFSRLGFPINKKQ